MKKRLIGLLMSLLIMSIMTLVFIPANATYAAIKYNIFFEENCADDGTMATLKNRKSGVEYTLTENAYVREGFSFEGWNTKEDGTGTAYEDKAVVKDLATKNGETVILYAQWKIIDYSITYNLKGGLNSEENPETYTIDDELIFENPEREGYTFKGWYLDSSYKSKITKIEKGSTGDVTVYAKWSKTKYTITYYLNSGINASSNPKKYYITSSNISLNPPTREGYTFMGWYTEKSYTNYVTEIPKGSTGDVTLYAKWSKTKYKITYEMSSGKNNSSNPSKYYITSKTIKLSNPTRDGYTFLGWYTDSKYKEKITEIPKGSTGDITLYARWDTVKYKITYNLNGGKNNSTNPTCYYVTSPDVVLAKPTKKGYEFQGWYTDSKFSEKVTSIPEGSFGDITLYAKWGGKTYTIAFDGNQGTTLISSINASTGQNITLPGVGVYGGFHCIGWNTKADGSGKMYNLLSDVKNLTTKRGATVTLYAVWEANEDNNNPLATPSLKGDRREDFIRVAGSQIGYFEKASGTPYGEYMGHATWPWCVYFVSWCAEKANIPASIIPREGSTRYLRNFYIARKSYYYIEGAIDGASTSYMKGYNNIKTISPYEVEKGDLILQESNNNIDQGADHTAIAVSYDAAGRFFWCVAGNTGNSVVGYGVKYYKVYLKEIHGVCKPAY